MTDLGSRTQQAVILVGGEGRRLGKLTHTCPKPLLDVGGIPFLEHLLLRCRANGMSRIVLLAGYLSDQVVAFAQNVALRFADLAIEVSIEPTPLGTAGALRHARNLLDRSFFLLNGDSVFDIAWQDLTDGAQDDAMAILAARPTTEVGRYGSMRIIDGRISAFNQDQGQSGEGIVNAGLYWMRRDIMDRIPIGCSSLEHDVFPVLAAESRLFAHIADGHFIDIGVKPDLALAECQLPIWNNEYLSLKAER